MISICIPTYKRARFLEQCISRMINQIETARLQEVFEIVVFNDNGADDTSRLMKKYQRKYHYVRYFESKKRFGLRKAIIHVASLAQADYIWFFSDDDLPTYDAVSTLLKEIKRHHPDIVFGNVDDFNKNKVVRKNIFKLKKNIVLKDKKAFFYFLKNKIFSITYFIAYISNFIIRRKLYEQYAYVNDEYDSPYNMTPLITPVLYTPMNCNFLILKQTVVLRRIENESWTLNDPTEKIEFNSKVSNYHFGNIQRLNFKIIPIPLHLYFYMHRIKNRCINTIAHLPLGFSIIHIYSLIENFFYQTLIKIK